MDSKLAYLNHMQHDLLSRRPTASQVFSVTRSVAAGADTPFWVLNTGMKQYLPHVAGHSTMVQYLDKHKVYIHSKVINLRIQCLGYSWGNFGEGVHFSKEGMYYQINATNTSVQFLFQASTHFFLGLHHCSLLFHHNHHHLYAHSTCEPSSPTVTSSTSACLHWARHLLVTCGCTNPS